MIHIFRILSGLAIITILVIVICAFYFIVTTVPVVTFYILIGLALCYWLGFLLLPLELDDDE